MRNLGKLGANAKFGDDITELRAALDHLFHFSRSWSAEDQEVWASDGDRMALCNSPDEAAYIAACSPDRIARLLDRLEAAERDAARYRKWRSDYTGGQATDMLIELADAWEPAQVDAAIDAPMQSEKQA